eukprot:7262909-Pyramimonas_sp.AAC.1
MSPSAPGSTSPRPAPSGDELASPPPKSVTPNPKRDLSGRIGSAEAQGVALLPRVYPPRRPHD